MPDGFVGIRGCNEQICEESAAHLNLAISLPDGGVANFNTYKTPDLLTS